MAPPPSGLSCITETVGYTRSYLAYRIGHWVPVWQPIIGSSFPAQPDVRRFLCSFMLQDLRRYAMWDSSATRPYTVSAISCWQRAADVGYVALTDDGKVWLLVAV
jgi:hypothetical protein